MNEETNLIHLEEAEETEENGFGVYVCRLREPMEWEGRTYEKLTFDFDSLKGRDVLWIVKELRTMGVVLVSRTFDLEYQRLYAVKCCREKAPASLLDALPAKDFDAICAAVQRFLVSTER